VKKTFRTFVAVEITGPIRARAAKLITALSCTTTNVKWVEPHCLHLTLKFLGEVHQREIGRVCQAVQHGASEVAPFELEIFGGGAFPNVARPRTVWLGCRDGTELMITLHDRIETALAKLGYREERRRFRPHLTIGRVRGVGPSIDELGNLLQQNVQFDAGHLAVSKVTIFASTLTSSGPIHESLGTARLGD